MTYIISFPRSGNTFLRYCIEYLTKRPTLGCFGSEDVDKPIHQRKNVNLNISNNTEAIARKAHKWWRISDRFEKRDKVILILRDYKEALIRHYKGNVNSNKILKAYGWNYFSLIKNFDSFNGRKQIVYYEDLIDDDAIIDVLINIKNFLNTHEGCSISDDDINDFVDSIDWHRQNSLNSYLEPTVTKGKSKKYHQNKLDLSNQIEMDNFFWDRDSFLANKYLLRYRKDENKRDVDMRLGFHGDKKLIQVVEHCVENSGGFIETGTLKGFSIGHIADKFPNVDCHSCEIDQNRYNLSKKYCRHLENVNLNHSGSIEFLKNIIESKSLTDKSVVFWLDAHGFGFEWPLKDEVRLISENFDNAIILIDDFKVPGSDQFGMDVYNDQECSFDYIEDDIQWKDYRMFYPRYKKPSESAYHPLRGWNLMTNRKDIDFESFGFIERVR